MKILNLLLKYFLSTEQGQTLKPLLELFEKNDFDVAKTLKNFDINAILPLATSFLNQKETPTKKAEELKLTPIQTFASNDVVTQLNNYFASGE